MYDELLRQRRSALHMKECCGILTNWAALIVIWVGGGWGALRGLTGMCIMCRKRVMYVGYTHINAYMCMYKYCICIGKEIDVTNSFSREDLTEFIQSSVRLGSEGNDGER